MHIAFSDVNRKSLKTRGRMCPKEKFRETVTRRCLRHSDVGIVV